MKDLSIIIPFVGEYPQVLFTIQAIGQNLIAQEDIDFEIIAVNNYCEEARKQAEYSAMQAFKKVTNRYFDGEVEETDLANDVFNLHKAIYPTYEDKSGPAIEACTRGNPWLKYIKYDGKLSHWQAKRVGVEQSEGDNLLFIDAHCLPSHNAIRDMFIDYVEGSFTENGERKYYWKEGAFHLPLTYKILEYHRLIYKLAIEGNYFYSYKFSGFRDEKKPYEVPCMSTCGMLISRQIYDAIGGWPKGLGIYGGGENFMNYTLAVCGFKKFIYPYGTLFHHGEKRDYHWNGDDMTNNRMIAHYIFGGVNLLHNFKSICKGNERLLDRMALDVIDKHSEHRKKIKAIQKVSIEKWAEQWK